MAGRRIRFTAVVVTVVCALTGFSSSGGSSGGSGSSGKSKSKSSGGGGCSSSKSSKKKTNSGRSGSSGSTATATPSSSPSGDPATAVVVTCVGANPPVTTLKVISRLARKATFEMELYRETASDAVVEATVVKVTLEARETRTVDVALENPARAAEVRTCRISSITVLADPTSSATSSSTPKGPTPTGSGAASTPTSTSKPKPKPAKPRS
ncbi:hypothetical protein ABZX75_08575 [Streptomyces sp. NPDC003038]|uniref:hypothetical protein n=1 Tax=unclassified Streptomyces TaxID=2593676 RepID=UPI0033A971FE